MPRPHYLALVIMLPTLAILAGDAASTRSVAHQSFYFVDSTSGRRTSHIETQLLNSGTDYSLRVTCHAIGPLIEPPPGFEERSGTNRITAEELALVLAVDPHLVTLRLDSGDRTTQAVRGPSPAISQGRLPERRLLANGQLRYQEQSREVYITTMALSTGALAAGRYQSELLVDGIPRVRLQFAVGPAGSEVRNFEALGDEGFNPWGLYLGVLESPTGQPPTTQPKSQPAADPKSALGASLPLADWAERDLEGKWVLYRRDVKERPENGKEWAKYLANKKEFELMEWVALHEGRTFEANGFGQAMIDAGALQWIRCFVWRYTRPDAKLGSGSPLDILLGHPGQSLAWLKRYPEAITGEVVALHEQLSQEYTPDEDTKLLPPLEPEEVFGVLKDPASELEEFGDRKKAEKGKIYRHQIERAIGAFATHGACEAPWFERFHAMTAHSDWRIRQKAYLQYCRIPAQHIPMHYAWAHAHDPLERQEVREAALLASSYAPEPEVYVRLHTIMDDPKHALWKPAVSRLGDLGDGYTKARMKALAPTLTELRPFLDTELQRVQTRWQKLLDQGRHYDHHKRILENIVAADQISCEQKTPLTEWAKSHFATWSRLLILEGFADDLTQSREGPDGERLQSEVRKLATKLSAEVLEELKKGE